MFDLAMKRALVTKLRALIAQEIATTAKAARDAAEAATHEEAKAENDKDTRGLEASYLARGQVERVRDLERSDNALQFLPLREPGEDDAVALGAAVALESEGARAVYFLAPAGGGMRVAVGAVEVQVVTPTSPLGRALVGKRAGDAVEIKVHGKVREYEIVEVG